MENEFITVVNDIPLKLVVHLAVYGVCMRNHVSFAVRKTCILNMYMFSCINFICWCCMCHRYIKQNS